MIGQHKLSAPLLPLACALAAPLLACVGGGQSLGEIADQAQSDVAASAFVLDRLSTGDATIQFASASLREYSASLGKRAKALDELRAKPADQDRRRTVRAAVADARQALDEARADISRERAGPIARRLHDDEQKLRPS